MRARRCIGAALTGIAIALAAAGPALASEHVPSPSTDAQTEVGSTPSLPTPIEPTTVPVPEVPVAPAEVPAAAPPPPIIVDVTEDAAGSVDVTVRVLSPGVDEANSPSETVIPDTSDADITSSPDPTQAPPEEAASRADPAGTNVNVSVRVLSPGDNGSVEQSTDFLPASGNDEATGSGPSGPAGATSDGAGVDDAADSTDVAENTEQYHEENSQYQSVGPSAELPWNWLWYLALDCAGNVLSTSTETGSPSSLDWAWNWDWEWSCNSPTHPPPLEDVVPRTGTPEPDDTDSTDSRVGAAPDSQVSEAGDPRWLWTWTFTFCGETVSALLPFDSRSPLAWTWDWTWSWTCEPASSEGTGDAGAPSPAAGIPLPAVPSPSGDGTSDAFAPTEPAQSGAGPGPLSWVPLLPLAPLLPTVSIAFPAISVVVTPISVSSLLDELEAATIAVVVGLAGPLPALPAVAIPLATGVTPLSASPAPSPIAPSPLPDPHGTAGSREPSARAPSAADVVRQHAHGSSAEAARPAKEAPKHSVAPRSKRGTSLPLPSRPVQVAGSSGAWGGVAPGGLVVGMAALVGFLLLSVPSLGRRVRAARELRPRGTYCSSIDRPG